MDLARILVAIVALGVLIIIHEAGHYLVAVWSGMKVSRFSVGFGPALFTSHRGGTEFRIGAIPLGGYVQIDGMHPDDGTDRDSPRSFLNRPRHLRAAAILAGPAANYLLAFGMLAVYFLNGQSPKPPVRVVDVQDGPAKEAGLLKGDLIVGTSSGAFQSLNDLFTVIDESDGRPVRFVVQRGEEEQMELSIAPRRVDSNWRIGIIPGAGAYEPLNLSLGESIARAGAEVGRVTAGIVKGLARLISRQEGGSVSGPIHIARLLALQLEQSFSGFFLFAAQLSIMLGFFNLLPIPALDGARLMFLAVSAIRRKEVEPRLEAVVHGVGFLILLSMMLIVSWFDLFK